MRTRLATRLLLAGAVTLLAAAWYAAHAGVRYVGVKRELAAARQRVLEAALQLPARAAQQATAPATASNVPAVESARAPIAEGVSPEFAARLENLKKTAHGRAPGGVPLIYPEDLFEYHAPLKAAYLEMVRGRQWVFWGAFFAEAKLTPGEIAQFEEYAMERERGFLEMRKTAEARGVREEYPAIQQIGADATKARREKIAALLGTERFRQFEAYERSAYTRPMLLGLHNLVATSFYTAELMTAAQMGQLATLTDELGMFSPSKASGVPDAFDQLAVRAAKILTPRQLEVFDLMLDQQQYSLAQYQLRSSPEPKK